MGLDVPIHSVIESRETLAINIVSSSFCLDASRKAEIIISERP